MRIVWNNGATRGFWLTPAIFGVLFILMGVLIYKNPDLLAYFVAGIFVLIGAVLIGVAWQTRSRITYRRLDDE